MIRIGLTTDAQRSTIGAMSGVLIVNGPELKDGGARTGVQRATFVPAAPGRAASARFRVQVASVAEEPAARQMARLAEDVQHQPSIVRFNPDTHSYQVRVGDFTSREEASAAAGALRRAGLSGSWVTEEREAGGGGRIRLLETGQELEVATIVPARAGEDLDLDSAPYRGWLEVRANATGALTVVNVLSMEEYLRGVVPNELSPTGYPQLEALKAQAVAARTYALRNRGQFQDQGFDLCATPLCQVYRGKASEHPLSDRAVLETRGLAATFEGRLVNALYTSTCGGHTEDGENVFEGEPTPYLRGVACLPERSAWTSIRTSTLPRANSISRDATLLVALGVLDGRRAPAANDGPMRDDEVRTWTGRLMQALHRKSCGVASTEALVQRGAFYRNLVQALCWDERARRLLAPGDSEYLLQVEDRNELAGEPARLAVALLLQEGLVSPFPDNTLRLAGVLTREELIGLLARAAAKVGAPEWLSAEFRSASDGRLEVKRGENLEAYALEADARLFRDLDGSRAAVSELSLVPGDPITFVIHEGRVVFLEARQSRLGPASDRSSRYYRWEVRTTPEELERTASKQASIGHVLDVVPRRLGVSGRVVELAVTGSTGELVLKGLKIRSFLGLRENLFVIERERDEKGGVQRFVFTGKGWGHGVGLCQVGAFGMAQAGATWEQILKHYYTGIRLDRLYQ
jgi:stage II sporulation protein D